MKKVFYFMLCATMAVTMISCGGNSSNTSTSYTSQYKSFRTAVDDGSIYPGMTYEQIAKICGESSYVSYSRGRVQYVYYGNYQLCFDNYGRYEYYNYSTY